MVRCASREVANSSVSGEPALTARSNTPVPGPQVSVWPYSECPTTLTLTLASAPTSRPNTRPRIALTRVVSIVLEATPVCTGPAPDQRNLMRWKKEGGDFPSASAWRAWGRRWEPVAVRRLPHHEPLELRHLPERVHGAQVAVVGVHVQRHVDGKLARVRHGAHGIAVHGDES